MPVLQGFKVRLLYASYLSKKVSKVLTALIPFSNFMYLKFNKKGKCLVFGICAEYDRKY